MLIAHKRREMSQTIDRPPIPQSMRHKRILDVAAEQPEASLETIATAIPSATAELVERVLDQYGDPADADTESTSPSGDSEMPTDTDPPDLDELTEKQRELLQKITEHPDATQQELGEMLGISAPTVSNRVSDIEGFDWTDRASIVETMFQTRGPSLPKTNSDSMAADNSGRETASDQLAKRVEALEQEVEAFSDTDESELVFEDPDLLHKILHACLKADTITEEEEFEILKTLL